MKKLLLLLLTLLICFVFLSCTKKNAKEVHVYNWSEYIPDKVLHDFEKETGIKVIYTTYDSNEAMYAKLKVLNGEGYDVTFPSTYYIKKMRDEGLIQKIDKTKLIHFNNIDPLLLNQPFDPENDYSIPFMWGTTGIGVNAKFIDPSTIKNWKDLWNPEYKGKLMLQNDVREVFHMALKSLGYSGNTTNEDEIKLAYEELKKIMPSVRLFNSDSPKVPFLNEEVHVGMIWGAEAFRAQQENPDIQFIYPEDGTALWADNAVILSKAKNVENAISFINYITRPDISAKISNETGYMSPVTTVKDYLDKNARESRIIFPEKEDLKNAEWQLSVGEAITVYQSYWERLKAGK